MKNQSKNSLIRNITKPCWQISQENSINCRIAKNFTKLCNFLPKTIRNKLLYFSYEIFLLISRFFLILSQVSLTGYIINGREKHSNEKITILFISNNGPCSYLLDILFLKKPEIEKIFKINVFNYKKKLKKINSKIDGVFIKSDRFYSSFFEKRGFKNIPEWVSMKLDVSKPWDSFYKNLSKGAKEDIRKTKKHGYTYEISTDEDKLKLFYNKMYLPYITYKYKNIGSCTNFLTIKYLFEMGNKILFIKLDDEYLFGGFFSIKEKKASASYAGVMEGKFDYVQKGVIAASYYHLIKHSIQSSVNEIDLGSCRPLINDGVLCYKKKWGATLEKTSNECPQIYSFKAYNTNKGIRNFLTNNQFIYLENNRLITEASNQNNKEL